MNENVIVNIISLYKPGVRLDNFLNELDILTAKGFNIFCVLQNYPDDIIRAIRRKNNVQVLITEAKNPGHASNIFLKEFYKMDYNYALMIHDDILLDAQLRTKEQDTIRYMIENIEKSEKDVAAITLQENSFVWRNLENPEIKETLHFWEPFYILKNLKKIYDLEIYFHEDIFGVEGTHFSCELLRNNLKVMFHYGQCSFKQLLYKSTYGDKETKKKKLIEYRKKIYELNKDIFNLTKNFQLRRKK